MASIATGLAEDALSGFLNDSRHKGMKLPEAFEKGIGDDSALSRQNVIH